jgi:hypothetical protein
MIRINNFSKTLGRKMIFFKHTYKGFFYYAILSQSNTKVELLRNDWTNVLQKIKRSRQSEENLYTPLPDYDESLLM